MSANTIKFNSNIKRLTKLYPSKNKRNEGLTARKVDDKDDNFTLQIQNLLFSGQRCHRLKRGGDSVAEMSPVMVKCQKDVHNFI